jgi:hypothetical protein
LAATSEKLVRLREQKRQVDNAVPTIKAAAETEIVAKAGTWKDYGSNDTERKRKLELEMSAHATYQGALAQSEELRLQIELQEVEVERYRRDVRLYTAMAGGYQLTISGAK